MKGLSLQKIATEAQKHRKNSVLLWQSIKAEF